MEFLTTLLVTVLGLLSPVNAIADQVAESTLRDQLYDAESLAVRVDNAPNYRLVQGRVQRLRVAGTGVMPLEGVRIARLGLEAEAIALNPQQLRQGTVTLEQPLEVAAQVVLTEADLNQALQSPTVVAWLQRNTLRVPGAANLGIERYALENPSIALESGAEGDRLQFQVTLDERRSERRLQIQVASGLAVQGGRYLRLVQPQVTIDGQQMPEELLSLFTQGLVIDLQTYADDGLLLRLIQLEIEDDQMAIAAWAQLQPSLLSP